MVTRDKVVKIGDFGLARNVYVTDIYNTNSKGPLPVRWMAPESIIDGVFTSQSDVWSYGVVLLEVATLAELPYQGLSNEEVISHIRSGQHPLVPEHCPDMLQELMMECWQTEPNERTTFLHVCK